MFENLRVSVFLAARALQRGGRGRVLLNIIVIAFVFTNMIFLPSVISGAVESYNVQTIDFMTSDIVIGPRVDERYIEDADTLLGRINRIPGVIRASARFSMPVSVDFEENAVSIEVKAFDPRDEVEVTRIHEFIEEGSFLGSGDRNEILLGVLVTGHEDKSKDFYDSLGGAAVGDVVTVRYANGVAREYRIKGIVRTKSYIADYMAFVTADEMESVLGGTGPNTRASEILVKATDDADLSALKRMILSFGVGEEVKTWEDATSDIVAESVESFNIINNITVIGSLIIAIVVIFILITIKTFTNRKQIGILKAIGIKKSVIINSYVMQVFFICTFGVILGLVILEAMVLYFTAYPIEFPDGTVTPLVDAGMLVENTVMLYLSSAVAGFIPAWRITNEKILDAMRGA
ncbi:MAG: ABC transporter permease [Methanomicrobiaceae archaeon]|nr:ABC transporter permease [Methanomicrobiaceae archaeon]